MKTVKRLSNEEIRRGCVKNVDVVREWINVCWDVLGIWI